MDWFARIVDWASDPAHSNLVRTLVAILAIPGAIWGVYLFVRWMRGHGIDSQIEKLHQKIDNITIETPDGERITFPYDEVEATIRAAERMRYDFLDESFTLKDVLRHAFGSLNNMDWRDTGDEYRVRDEQTAWNLLGKVPQIQAVARRRNDVSDRIKKAREVEAHSDVWAKARIPESAEVCQILGAIIGDATALNLFNLYKADSQYHSVSKLVATKFGMAVMKQLMLQS